MTQAITPTTGRVVLFKPIVTSEASGVSIFNKDAPFAATVAFVNNDGTINLSVVDHNGNQFAAQGVVLVQPGEPLPDAADYAYWMPYQVAQAASAAVPTVTEQVNVDVTTQVAAIEADQIASIAIEKAAA